MMRFRNTPLWRGRALAGAPPGHIAPIANWQTFSLGNRPMSRTSTTRFLLFLLPRITHARRRVFPWFKRFTITDFCAQCQPLSRRPHLRRMRSHSLLRSIVHGCYHGSRLASAAVAGMLTAHGLLNTWTEQVDLFLVCTEFARRKFVGAGFDEEHIRVKPNSLLPILEPICALGISHSM